ncbi:MAG: serine/threonine-protein kinase [Tepidisphaeraceae bacterium]
MPKEIFGYEVLDYIGEGAGSLLYVVTDPVDRQLYALKHVVRRKEKDARFFEQLQTEFEIYRQFNHPALRRSLLTRDNGGFMRKPTEVMLLMELFDGVTLEHFVRADSRRLVDIFIQVAQGLGSLHALGFIHCDLKPNNILVSPENQAKIIDFGQCARAGSVKERIQGTPDFISPEQVRCDPVTPRTDVFNLGATMYWTLTGRAIPTLYTLKREENSFLVDARIMSPHDISSAVPEPLSNLIMECVRTNPSKRPQDMTDLSRRLEVVQHGMNRQVA